ncbi:MAG: TetR/AcrR family transcriptional regulator [Mycobacterium sp.]
MPLVAKSLGVGVTSIYWHIRNKSELLDAMTDRALRRSGLPVFVESVDWRESLMTHARGVRETLLGNPVLTDLILIRGALSPMARRLGAQETDKAIASMIEAGLDRRKALEMYSAVSLLVRGSVLLERLAQKHGRFGDVGLTDDDGAFADTEPSRDDRAFDLLLKSVLADSAHRDGD